MEKETHLTDNDGEQPRDNFYHGVISKIFWSNETGVIHSDGGKEVPFIFAFVTLLGAPRQDINFLRPGMRVGFDVGQTSKGLRASTIKIYDLYQDDIIPERGSDLSYPSEAKVTVEDHPISHYRLPEMTETAEPPHYRQRRPRPRLPENANSEIAPQEQEQKRLDSRPQKPENNRPDAPPQGLEPRRPEVRPQKPEYRRPEPRPQGQEQRRSEPRSQGQEQRRPEPRPQGQEQRRPESRPQGQRREGPPQSPGPQNSRGSEPARTDTTTSQPNERSQGSRRRRGRR